MRATFVTVILSFAIVAQQVAAEPPAGREWVAIDALTDEFNGDRLDAAKWFDHNPRWLGRKPGLFKPENVSVREGMLQLTARAEELKDAPAGYHSFSTAAVRSKDRVLYGYFEIRCRPMDSRASSAFWFYHNTPEEWTEIDVFEIGGAAPKHEYAYHMNVHLFHNKDYRGTNEKHLSDSDIWKSPYRLADEFHVYGLEWDREAIKWYVDGEVVRTKENQYWHQPLHMDFDSETMPDWFGLPRAENLPSTFRIDWVRSWRISGETKVIAGGK